MCIRDSSISMRGVIWDEGLNKAIDYTTLNEDPLSSIDCGETGLNPDGSGIKGCRSIEEDYEWENILKQSCGCCDCNPEYIDYHNKINLKPKSWSIEKNEKKIRISGVLFDNLSNEQYKLLNEVKQII